MTKYPLYQVAEITHWPPGHEPRLKFRLIETNWTCDGPRSRLTNHSFATQAEAEAFVPGLQRHD